MFDVGMQELLVVFVVALVFIGPKRLPEIARTLGKLMGELRRAGDELKGQIDLEAMMQERDEPYRNDANLNGEGTTVYGTAPAPEPSTPTTGGVAQQADEPVQEKDPEKTET